MLSFNLGSAVQSVGGVPHSMEYGAADVHTSLMLTGLVDSLYVLYRPLQRRDERSERSERWYRRCRCTPSEQIEEGRRCGDGRIRRRGRGREGKVNRAWLEHCGSIKPALLPLIGCAGVLPFWGRRRPLVAADGVEELTLV